MMIYDVGIIGAGVAGSFASLKLAKEHKNVKAILFDLGRPPMKRRRQLEGWLGCLPNSDGKLYLSDLPRVSNLLGNRKTNATHKWVNNYLSNVNNFKVIKDKSPLVSTEKKIKKIGYDIVLNDHMQMYPKDIHQLSKNMADDIEKAKNITFAFDTEIMEISREKNYFVVKARTLTTSEEYKCKKIILAVGRSGWRWVSDIFTNFGIIENNDYAKFGIKVEMNSAQMKEFNKSNCSLFKGTDLEIGPLSWNGTVIPEDHVELAITTFRSNENRWKSDKVSFSIIGNRLYPKQGYEQTDRLGKLTYVLSNDRILKERVSTILNKKSKISVLREYDWLIDTIQELSMVMPDIATKAYFHVPTIMPMAPTINIGTNMESEVPGMFVVGETAGISGLLSAAVMGAAVGDTVCK